MADDLREKLRAIIAEVSEVDEIPDATPFKDLGIDSMMAIEIVAEIERTYKLSVPESELTPERLAAELARLGADRGALLGMARKARALARPRATADLADAALAVAGAA